MTTDRDVLNALLRSDLGAFIERCFYELNPGQKWHPNWHIEALTCLLKRCAKGEINRVLILMPPRHLKSTIVTVAWTAYMLGLSPEKRFICASYGQDLASKLSNDTRTIMMTDWYQSAFPHTRISPFKDTQESFQTTKNGGRLATSVGGTMTGFGADIVILDDPQKPVDMHSESSRRRATDWLNNTVMSRFNDPKSGVLVVVMQRLHVDDLAAHLETLPGMHVLKIPIRAQEDLEYRLESGVYRFQAGAYLDQRRFGPNEYVEMRNVMGPRDFSPQFLQNPIPSEGGTFDSAWLHFYTELPQISEMIMSVDVAATEGGGDFTAITIWGHLNRHWYMIDAYRYQHDLSKVRLTIERFNKEYQPDLIIVDSNGVGAGLTAELRAKGMAHVLAASRKYNKEHRAMLVAPMIENGRVHCRVNASGLDAFQKEIMTFPNGKNDDLVDSMTQLLMKGDLVISKAQPYKRAVRRGIKSKCGTPILMAFNV